MSQQNNNTENQQDITETAELNRGQALEAAELKSSFKQESSEQAPPSKMPKKVKPIIKNLQLKAIPRNKPKANDGLSTLEEEASVPSSPPPAAKQTVDPDLDQDIIETSNLDRAESLAGTDFEEQSSNQPDSQAENADVKKVKPIIKTLSNKFDKDQTDRILADNENLYDDTETDMLDKINPEELKKEGLAAPKDSNDDDLTIDFLKSNSKDKNVASLESYNKVMYKHQEKLRKEQIEQEQEKQDEASLLLNAETDMEKTTIETLEEFQKEEKEKKKQKNSKAFFYLLSSAICVVLIGGVYIFTNYLKHLDTAEEPTIKQKVKPKRKKVKTVKKQAEKKSAAELFSLGKYQDALNEYLKEHDTADTSADILQKIGECYLKLNQPEKAYAFYKKAYDNGFRNGEFLKTYANMELNKKNNQKVVSIVRAALEEYPENSSLYLTLGDSLYSLGHHKEALHAYDKVMQKNFSFQQMLRYAKLLLNNGFKPKAHAVYLKAGKSFHNSKCYLKALELTSDTSKKSEILQYAINDLKRNNQEYNGLALIYSQLLISAGKMQEAKDVLKTISPSGFSEKDSLRFFTLLVNTGLKNKAKKEIQKIIASYPKQTDLHIMLQDLLTFNGLQDLSQQVYSDWYKLNKNAYSSFFYARTLGTSTSAKVYYNKATRLKPDYFQAHKTLATLYMNQKAYPLAQEKFTEALKYSPKNKDLLFLQAISIALGGNKTKAFNDYKKTLKTFQNESKTAYDLLKFLEIIPNQKLRDKYLQELSNDNTLIKEYITQLIRSKLISNTITDSDFSPKTRPFTLQYYAMYLLSKGKENQVLKLDTSKDPAADFWQVFTMWRNDNDIWKPKALALLSNKDLSSTYKYSLAILLDKVESPKAINHNLAPDALPLIYFIYAKKLEKDGNKMKARIYNIKAEKFKNSIYAPIIKYYR